MSGARAEVERIRSLSELGRAFASRGIPVEGGEDVLALSVTVGGQPAELRLRWKEPLVLVDLGLPLCPEGDTEQIASKIAELNQALDVLGYTYDPASRAIGFRCHAAIDAALGLSFDWLGRLVSTAIDAGEQASAAFRYHHQPQRAACQADIEVHPLREAEEWWWLTAGSSAGPSDLAHLLEELRRTGWTPYVAVQGARAVGRAEVERPHRRLAVVTDLVVRDDLALHPKERLALGEALLDNIVQQQPEELVAAAVWSGEGDRLLAEMLERRGIAPYIEKEYVYRSLADVTPSADPFGWSSLAEIGRDAMTAALARVIAADPNRDVSTDATRELDELIERAGDRFDPRHFGVVTLQGRLAGVLAMSRFPEWPEKGTVLYMGLCSSLRGRALGLALHRRALASLKAMGAATYVDSTDVLNAPMRAVFRRNGCRPLAIRSEHWLRPPLG